MRRQEYVYMLQEKCFKKTQISTYNLTSWFNLGLTKVHRVTQNDTVQVAHTSPIDDQHADCPVPSDYILRTLYRAIQDLYLAE